MANKYTANTIESLDYFEHIRKYPGMYIGSKDIHGLHHCLKEILSNSIDEYLNGACSEIIVKLLQNNGIYIKDNGRGIPHGTHKSGCSVLQACYGIANTGGKFNNATGESGYNSSGGEHGTGGKAVNALSTKMIVTTSNEGYKEIVEFSKGKFISYTKEKSTETGVEVTFYPDDTIFETVKFDEKALKTMLQEFSYLCSGLRFRFENGPEVIEYYSENGLEDYINYLNKDKKLICDPFYFENKEDSFQVEVAIAYNATYSSIYKLYTNNIPQEKGTHLTGFKMAWITALNSFAREEKLLKEKEDNLSSSDFEEGQVLILNFKMIDPVFKGQNKEELSSSEGRSYVQKLTSDALKNLLLERKNDFKLIITKALAARRAREAAKKARDAAREPKNAKGLKAKMALSDKFIDCSSKKPSERKLFILEGVSAGSAAVEARNPCTDAIYLLKGKIVSPLKSDVKRITENQEMSDLIKIIGGGFGENFDINKMNFDKIIIFSDSDADGDQICLLLMGFFYNYMRPLVEAGKLYRGAAPLYTVKIGKEEEYFYTDKSYQNWVSQNIGKTFTVLRGKGVGELEASDLNRLCFASERFKRLVSDDLKASFNLLNIFLGDSVTIRRNYIYENAKDIGFGEY